MGVWVPGCRPNRRMCPTLRRGGSYAYLIIFVVRLFRPSEIPTLLAVFDVISSGTCCPVCT